MLTREDIRKHARDYLTRYARSFRDEAEELSRPGRPRPAVLTNIQTEMETQVMQLASDFQELQDRRTLHGEPLLPPGERDKLLTKMQQMLNLHGVYDRDFFIAEVKKIIMEQENLTARIDRAKNMIDAIVDVPIGASSSELKTLRKILSGENPEDGA